MPLDPQAQAFLAQLAAMGAPPLEQLPVDQVRAIYRQLFGGNGEPEAVGNVVDRTIAGPGGPIPLRIYTPNGSGPFPVLVHLREAAAGLRAAFRGANGNNARAGVTQ